MTAAAGTYVAGQQSLVIAAPGHPLAAGLTGHRQTVASAAGDTRPGQPQRQRRRRGPPVRTRRPPATFAYDTGAAMPGLAAPARRVGLFMWRHDRRPASPRTAAPCSTRPSPGRPAATGPGPSPSPSPSPAQLAEPELAQPQPEPRRARAPPSPAQPLAEPEPESARNALFVVGDPAALAPPTRPSGTAWWPSATRSPWSTTPPRRPPTRPASRSSSISSVGHLDQRRHEVPDDERAGRDLGGTASGTTSA